MIPALGRQDDAPRDAHEANRSVLVVDEALPVRNALREILQKLGHGGGDVCEATTPQEALARFRKDPPHLVFCELIGTHAEEGLEVVHEMLDKAPTTKIVLVTAEPLDGAEVRAAVRAGVFAVIEKPVRHEKIRHVLQEIASEEGGIERLR